MYQAYIDDSGNQPPIAVLAGFLSTETRWAHFSDKWQDELGSLPSISYFKANECEQFQGQFRTFTPDQRDTKRDNLWQIIKDHVLYGAAVTIKFDHIQASLKGKISVTFDSPYFTLSTTLMNNFINRQYIDGLPGEVSFIFDQQYGAEREVTSFYEKAMSNYRRPVRRRLGPSPVWRDEKKVLPLQAADLLAWTIRRAGSDGMASGSEMGSDRVKETIKSREIPLHLLSYGEERLSLMSHHMMTKLEQEGLSYETKKMRSNRYKNLLKTERDDK